MAKLLKKLSRSLEKWSTLWRLKVVILGILLSTGCSFHRIPSDIQITTLPTIALGKIKCDLNESCFWFRQLWPQQYLQNVNAPNAAEYILDIDLTHSRTGALYKNKQDADRYHYTITGKFTLQQVNNAATPNTSSDQNQPSFIWEQYLTSHSYYNTFDSPFVRDMLLDSSQKNSIKLLQQQWINRWQLRQLNSNINF